MYVFVHMYVDTSIDNHVRELTTSGCVYVCVSKMTFLSKNFLFIPSAGKFTSIRAINTATIDPGR